VQPLQVSGSMEMVDQSTTAAHLVPISLASDSVKHSPRCTAAHGMCSMLSISDASWHVESKCCFRCMAQQIPHAPAMQALEESEHTLAYSAFCTLFVLAGLRVTAARPASWITSKSTSRPAGGYGRQASSCVMQLRQQLQWFT
jgi:hypothetical protein